MQHKNVVMCIWKETFGADVGIDLVPQVVEPLTKRLLVGECWE